MATGQIRKNEAIFWVALGAFVCFLGWRIKIGTFRAPGPGFFALGRRACPCDHRYLYAFFENCVKGPKRGWTGDGSCESGGWSPQLAPRRDHGPPRCLCRFPRRRGLPFLHVSRNVRALLRLGKESSFQRRFRITGNNRCDLSHFPDMASDPTAPRNLSMVVKR